MHSGIPRLIKLCRSPTERNNSDSVLVACLVGTFQFLFHTSPEKCRKNSPLDFKRCISRMNSYQCLLILPWSVILYNVNYLSSDWRFKHIRKSGFIFTLVSTGTLHNSRFLWFLNSILWWCCVCCSKHWITGVASPLPAYTHMDENT